MQNSSLHGVSQIDRRSIGRAYRIRKILGLSKQKVEQARDPARADLSSAGAAAPVPGPAAYLTLTELSFLLGIC
jgi:hypothetical protein